MMLKMHPQLQGRDVNSIFSNAKNIQEMFVPHIISTWLRPNPIFLLTKEHYVLVCPLSYSVALNKGVDVKDIGSLGNWKPCDIFRNH